MGIEMNIQTWNLLDKKDRSEQDDLRMVIFAKSSLYHWKKSPKFQPVNEQRGEWMISHVYAVLGKSEKALAHAKKTMGLTEKHGFKDFDLAYAYESMARGYAASGKKKKCRDYWQKARNVGDLILDEKDKEIFKGDLKAEPWFDCLD